jgi:hypothetical protein
MVASWYVRHRSLDRQERMDYRQTQIEILKDINSSLSDESRYQPHNGEVDMEEEQRDEQAVL